MADTEVQCDPDLLLRFTNGTRCWLKGGAHDELIELLTESAYDVPLQSQACFFEGARVSVDTDRRSSFLDFVVPENEYGNDEYIPTDEDNRTFRKLPQHAVVEEVRSSIVVVQWAKGPMTDLMEYVEEDMLGSEHRAEEVVVMHQEFSFQLGESFRVRKGCEEQAMAYFEKTPRPANKGEAKRAASVEHLPMAGIITDVETGCAVRWQDGSISNHTSMELFTYDSEGHDFWPGCFVSMAYEIRPETTYGVVQSVDVAAQVCSVVWVDALSASSPEEATINPPEEHCILDLMDHPTLGEIAVSCICSCYSTVAGEVLVERIGKVEHISEQGFVRMVFVDGTESTVLPLSVAVIAELDSDFEGDADDEEASYSGDDAAQEVADQTVLGEQLGWWGNGLASSHACTDEEEEAASEANPVLDTTAWPPVDQSLDSSFVVCSEVFPGHPFREGQQAPPIRRIQKEWLQMQKGLPKGVHVRVFEDRMDVMQFVIIGAAGTPYGTFATSSFTCSC